MSWRRCNLGELVDNVSIRAKDIIHENNLRFLGVSNEDGITISKYAAEDKAEDYKIIEKGCFAYNPYRINVGSIALMMEDNIGLISPAYIVFRPKPNMIIPELLLSFLKSNEGLRQIKINARGTVRQALRFEDLCKIQLSLPSYDEQIELYLKLQKFEKQGNTQVIEYTHQLNLLKKLRQQILQDAVQGKLVPQDPNDENAGKLLERIKAEREQLIREKIIKKGKPLPEIKLEEIPFEIPEGWVWCRLGEICAKIGSGSTPIGSNYSKDGKPFFRSQNIHDTGLVYDDIKFINDAVHHRMNGTRVYPFDILLNITGGSLGRCAVVPKDFIEGNVSQHVCIIRPISLSCHFIHNVVLSPYFQKLVFESTTGAGREGLPKYNLEQFIIPVPPLTEQQRIVTKIEQLMNICDQLEQSIQQNQKYTKELLQVALQEALEPNGKVL